MLQNFCIMRLFDFGINKEHNKNIKGLYTRIMNTVIPPDTPLQWLYVDFNSYFASVEQQLNPALRGRPVAVAAVDTDATCAIAASYEAKKYGVKTNTPIWEARKMCPGLVVVVAQHQKYVEFHQKILKEIDRHIPVTAVCSIDEMACRLMKNEQSLEAALSIAGRIKEGLRENVGAYITCSIGLAPNRYLAKIATDMQKPNGLTILQAHELPERLYDLSLRDLPGIGRNMEKRLHYRGIGSVRQLVSYQPKHLRALWGNVWGEKVWYMLHGMDIEPEPTTRRTIGHSQVLAPHLRPADAAYPVTRRLLIKAAARLRRMDYTATTLALSVRLEEGPRFGLEMHTKPAADNFTFLAMLEKMWHTVMHEVRGQQGGYIRLKKVSVTLYGLAPAGSAEQIDLFEVAETKARAAATATPHLPRLEDRAGSREQREKLSAAMDALNRKFGRDTVMPGIVKTNKQDYSGTKVAFTRIPDMEEFLE